MALFHWGLERFIRYVSENKPTHIEVTTDLDEGGDAQYVCEHFGVFTGYYENGKPIVARKKYGGTKSTPEEMAPLFDADIQRLQEMKIDVFKIKGFVNESDKEHS
ncbi:hypothetical protein KY338_03175 [Candidatus Woesearchaeota archaeon]|nr:hypothetical protein [Candidatus Woesearchaeota archaeon]MBW3005646.1 hypothetical protein [Candidatus Woesearchaeota archaeon]